MGIETAVGKQSFKLASILFFSELSSPSGVLLTARRCMQFADSTCKVIKRVTDYLLQQHQKLFEPF
jgi:hypothetical protein